MTILIFLIVLSILVLVHEAGHFLIAKLFKIKVEEFGMGFPPRLFGKKIGETLYSVNALPIGGFVKLYGEDAAGSGQISIKEKKIKELPRAFFARPAWQRFLVIFAGVCMNFLLAVLILTYLFGVTGVKTPGDKVIIAEVTKGSPAEAAGITKNSTVEAINGNVVKSPQELILKTRDSLGKEITLTLKTPQGEEKIIKVTPRKTYPQGEGPLGIALTQNIIIQKYPWYEAPLMGVKESWNSSLLILSGLGTTVSQLFQQRQVPQGVAGPVGIAELTGQFVQFGPEALLGFVALLSLNLAILNVLPIPALDGGRLFFIILETITRKKVSPKVEGYIHAAGMIILLSFIALITFHDLTRLFSGQPLLPK